MLYIDRGRGLPVTWHVGQPVPVMYAEVHQVQEIQADGAELEIILKICSNVPSHDGRVVRWFGDHAKFIIASLLNYNIKVEGTRNYDRQTEKTTIL